jgi:hypothetical protein
MSENYIEGLFDEEDCGLHHLKVDIECAYLENGEAIIPQLEKHVNLFKDIAEISVLELYKVNEEFGAFAELLYRLVTLDENDLKSSVRIDQLQAVSKLKGRASSLSVNEDPTVPTMKGGMMNGIRRRFVAAAAPAQGVAPPAQARQARIPPAIQAVSENLRQYVQSQINAAGESLRAAPRPAFINRLLVICERITAFTDQYATPERRESFKTFLITTTQLLQSCSHYAWTNSGMIFNDSLLEEQILQGISFRDIEANEIIQYNHTMLFYTTMKEQAQVQARVAGAQQDRINRGIQRIDTLMQERTTLHEQLLRNQQNPYRVRVILRSIIVSTRRLVFWSFLLFVAPRLLISILEYGVQYLLIPGVDMVLRDIIAFLLGQVHESSSAGWRTIYSGIRSTVVAMLFGTQGIQSPIQGLPNIPGMSGIITTPIPGTNRTIQDMYQKVKESAIVSIFNLISFIPAATIANGIAAVWGLSFMISLLYYSVSRNSIEQGRFDLLVEFDRRVRPTVVASAAAINRNARAREGRAQAEQPFVTAFGNIFYGGKTRRRHTKKRKHTRKH